MLKMILGFTLVTASLLAAPFSLKKAPITPPEEPIYSCEPRATLASAQPCSECTDLFISVSALLWQAKTWGLEFAAKSYVPNVVGGTAQTFEEKLFVPDFSWQPGFQLLLGGYLPYDGWDIRAGWIVYQEKFTDLKKHFDSVTTPDGIGIIPLWQYPFLQVVGGNTGSPLRYSEATGHWKMTFNSVDLELGRRFFPEEPLPLRLNIGAKFATIQQKYKAVYGQGNTILASTPQGTTPSLFHFVSSQFTTKIDQWGLGPRFGLESQWSMRWGFNLIAHGAFSILASFFDVRSEYNDVIEPTPGPCNMTLKEHFTELTPVCEAMLGLDWGKCFNKLYFGMTLGYAWQYWWSVNHARRNYVQTLPGETFDMRGELQMQGLNAAIKCNF